MQVRFLQNLGLLDLRAMNDAAKSEVAPNECAVGAVVDLPARAVEFITAKYGAKQSLFEVVAKETKSKPESTAKQGG
jgi:hypothetical protein